MDLGDPHISIDTLLSRLKRPGKLYSALYMNNIDRDPKKIIAESDLVRRLYYYGMRLERRTIVTDSISAGLLDRKLVESHFNGITISPRSKDSMERCLVKYLRKKSSLRLKILFTIGVDDFDVITMAVDNGIKIELNVTKPLNISSYLTYMQTLTAFHGIKELDGFLHDQCINYVESGRNCYKPDDGVLEATTFLNSNMFYLCAYPSNECIARLSHLAMQQETK